MYPTHSLACACVENLPTHPIAGYIIFYFCFISIRILFHVIRVPLTIPE